MRLSTLRVGGSVNMDDGLKLASVSVL